MIDEKNPRIRLDQARADWHIPDELSEKMSSALEMYSQYQAAIREMSTRFEILDDEFQLRHSRNPIHHMQSRLKSPQSLLDKLKRKNLPQSITSAIESLFDIAGIRVVCSYLDDVYALVDMISRQDDLVITQRQDYIQAPKPNGYRSLHLIVRVPVFFSDKKLYVPVEIQIRTIAMDFWASLEHDLRYKPDGTVDESIAQELVACSEEIAKIDGRMQRIAKAIGHDGPTIRPI